MESLDHVWFFWPGLYMSHDLFNNFGIFLIFLLQVVLQLIGIKSFSDQDISDRVDIGVSLSGNFFSNILDVVLVPVFLFVDICKGRF